MARQGMIGRVGHARSLNMAKIKNKNTKPEIILRKNLTALGLRYRLHQKNLPGTPDIVFPTIKLAVFCDGDFWHGRNWKQRKLAGEFKTRRFFWIKKIEKNIARDKKNNKDLKNLGWKVLRFWSSDITKNAPEIARKILKVIEANSSA